MIDYYALVKINRPFNVKQIKGNLKVIRATTKEHIQIKKKLEIFEMVGRIVVKQIDSFMYSTKDYSTSIFHTQDSLVSEAFIVFDKCVKNCDLDRVKSFPFMLNTALNREFKRIIGKHYRKHFNVYSTQRYDEAGVSYDKGIPIDLDFIDFYIENAIFNFTDIQKEIIYSKLKQEKTKEFLDRRNDISQGEYYTNLKIIKSKLSTIKTDLK